MAEIIIDKSYSTQKDIELCIEAFNGITDDNCNLQINFTEQIKEIDILLIAYMTLFKELKPNINITVKLNIEVDEELKFKLYQYLIYTFLMTGKSVFTIINSNENSGGLYINEKSPPKYFHQFFVLSQSFIPILLIGKLPESDGIDLFDILFKRKIEGLDVMPQGVDFDSNSEHLYNNLSKWIKGYENKDEKKWSRGVINPGDRIECIQYLSRLAFFNSLKKAKITSLYLCKDEEKRKSIQVGNIPYAKTKEGKYPHIEFFKEIKWIFDDLSDHPPIYHFVYSQLLSSELLPTKFDRENKEKIVKIIRSLWEYTKDMVDGIKELAKNVREHSNPPIGAITGRIYKEDRWFELKKIVKGADIIFDEYLNSLKEKYISGSSFSFFDFNVIDLGKKGVIETLKDKTNEMTGAEYLDESVKSLISEDVKALNNNEIKLKHFLDPTLGNTLNLQTKKAIAHLGLLIFSSLIKENEGLLRAGSVNCEPFLTYFNYSSTGAFPVPFGTNYHVVLPISAEKEIKTILPHPLNIPLESTQVEIKGIEELLNYDLKDLNDKIANTSNSFSEKKRYLYRIILNKIELNNKDDEIELWNNVNIVFNKYYRFHHKPSNIVCIDFNNVEINESQLFRFLGTWNLNYPNVNLIVVNITSEVFNELIKTNEHFLDKYSKIINSSFVSDNAIYWNENSLILIYSYCEPKQNEERFYFTDVLWGIEKQDFYRVNMLIKKTNFNATTILLQNEFEEKYNDLRLSFLAQSGFFHSKTTLLPFDLLLPGIKGLTLFEHNASILLQNELQFPISYKGDYE